VAAIFIFAAATKVQGESIPVALLAAVIIGTMCALLA
jgi:hypothetical protein